MFSTIEYFDFLRDKIIKIGGTDDIDTKYRPGKTNEASQSGQFPRYIDYYIIAYEDYLACREGCLDFVFDKLPDDYRRSLRDDYRRSLRSEFLSYNRDKKIDICLTNLTK